MKDEVIKKKSAMKVLDEIRKCVAKTGDIEAYRVASECADAVHRLLPEAEIEHVDIDGDRIVMLASQIRYMSDVALRETEGDGASEQRIAGNIAHCCMIIDELAAEIERCIEEVDTP